MTTIKRLLQGLKFFIIVVCVVTILFVLIEGPANTIGFFRNIISVRLSAERVHTEYDQLLGWKNIPNICIKDMYGPGIYLRTNSQSFRNNDDFTVAVPKDKLRIICSGDSFTLGYGLDNDHAWPQLLGSIDQRLEVVNMGQGGYGIDQSYLWYMRDGAKLEHDIYIFAFVVFDFVRMRHQEFLGYGKPILKLEDAALVVENTPVPPRPYYIPRLTRNLENIEDLRSVRFLRKLFRKIVPYNRATDEADYYFPSQGQIRQIVLKIFESLQQINKEKNSTLVVVFLPTQGDWQGSHSRYWQDFLSFELAKRDIVFVDVIDELKRLKLPKAMALFAKGQDIPYAGAGGHYSIQGSEYIAGLLYEKLSSFPETAAKLLELK